MSLSVIKAAAVRAVSCCEPGMASPFCSTWGARGHPAFTTSALGSGEPQRSRNGGDPQSPGGNPAAVCGERTQVAPSTKGPGATMFPEENASAGQRLSPGKKYFLSGGPSGWEKAGSSALSAGQHGQGDSVGALAFNTLCLVTSPALRDFVVYLYFLKILEFFLRFF